ncbi:hypothetical protein BX666DRAFT_910300 [Dichotomocladium elegans]|nr:hypothetical protein BX666DRAFT_910300 [Dichotomocladium elegans]
MSKSVEGSITVPTTLTPSFYEVFEAYFRETRNSASLADFVDKNASFIARQHNLGEDLKSVWTTRYAKALEFFRSESSEESQIRPTKGKKPNWSQVAERIVEEQRNGIEESIPSASTSKTSTKTSTDTAATLTTAFIESYRAMFDAFDNNDKWVLPSGAVVEDVMFSYGLTCRNENPCHSFILDVDDPIWLTLFPDEMDRKVLFEHKRNPLPEIKPELKEYLSSYIGKVSCWFLFRCCLDKILIEPDRVSLGA